MYKRQATSKNELKPFLSKLDPYKELVVCFASPGAVEAFAEQVGESSQWKLHCVVIGETTRRALEQYCGHLSVVSLQCLTCPDVKKLAQTAFKLAADLSKQ